MPIWVHDAARVGHPQGESGDQVDRKPTRERERLKERLMKERQQDKRH